METCSFAFQSYYEYRSLHYEYENTKFLQVQDVCVYSVVCTVYSYIFFCISMPLLVREINSQLKIFHFERPFRTTFSPRCRVFATDARLQKMWRMPSSAVDNEKRRQTMNFFNAIPVYPRIKSVFNVHTLNECLRTWVYSICRRSAS